MAGKFLANSFSALELNVEDEHDDKKAGAATLVKNGNHVLRSKNNKNGVSANARCSKENTQSTPEPTEELKMPLVWIDLEMTGLDVSVDRIIEIACIVTDGNLSKSIEGPDLVIHQSKECMDRMGEWCQDHHGASGLTQEVLRSKVSEKEAEKQVTDFITKHVRGPYKPLLAGNSVYVDLMFMKKYMPDLASLFSHVLVDVSSVKALCLRWYPKDCKRAPSKENNHRALDDIRESIKELRFYKSNIFKAKRTK
ncbi:polynucleotidyl transferase, ribonuclease H-like superfamily protein isoform X2 [Wolffia australiana]